MPRTCGVSWLPTADAGGGPVLVLRFVEAAVTEVRITGRNLEDLHYWISEGCMPWIPGSGRRPGGPTPPPSAASPSRKSSGRATCRWITPPSPRRWPLPGGGPQRLPVRIARTAAAAGSGLNGGRPQFQFCADLEIGREARTGSVEVSSSVSVMRCLGDHRTQAMSVATGDGSPAARDAGGIPHQAAW